MIYPNVSVIFSPHGELLLGLPSTHDGSNWYRFLVSPKCGFNLDANCGDFICPFPDSMFGIISKHTLFMKNLMPEGLSLGVAAAGFGWLAGILLSPLGVHFRKQMIESVILEKEKSTI